MARSLVDTSTFFDIEKALQNSRPTWATNTIANLNRFYEHHQRLIISAWTVFEHLDGLHRTGQVLEAEAFIQNVVPNLEVIYPDQATFALAAKVHAALVKSGRTIGVVDTFIAATAIINDLDLVTANSKHFERIQSEGYPLRIQNWREF